MSSVIDKMCKILGVKKLQTTHYLMFGQRPRLSVDFHFPTFRSAEAPMREASAKHVDEYVATVSDQLRTALQEGSSLIDNRSPTTEMVLLLKDRHHGSEAWPSGLSED